MPTFDRKAVDFYRALRVPRGLPRGVEAMNPYATPPVMRYVNTFFRAFFHDDRERVFVFGINPGRFGAGLTGVTFTDPVALENNCGINNDLEKRREVSSDFVYRFIEQWGGPKKFFSRFFLTAVSPLGFTRGGVNYNYYDDPQLLTSLQPFITMTLRKQLSLGARRDIAIVLGTGKNQKAFDMLNKNSNFFSKVQYLEHPRFIMQYRRKKLAEYLKKYSSVFTSTL